MYVQKYKSSLCWTEVKCTLNSGDINLLVIICTEQIRYSSNGASKSLDQSAYCITIKSHKVLTNSDTRCKKDVIAIQVFISVSLSTTTDAG